MESPVVTSVSRALQTLVLAAAALGGLAAYCQSSASGGARAGIPGGSTNYVIPEMTLSFEEPEKLSNGIPSGSPLLLPTIPLADGSFVVRYITPSAFDPSKASMPQQQNPTVVRVKSATESVVFSTAFPGLENIAISGPIAVSTEGVVMLFDALTGYEKLNDPDLAPHPFIALFDLEGKLIRTAPIDLKNVSVQALGLFSDGEVLVAGYSVVRSTIGQNRLMIFDDQGEFQRELASPDSDAGSQKTQVAGFSRPGVAGVLPYQGNLLLEYNSPDAVTLEEWGPHGMVAEFVLKMPNGMSGARIIPTDGPDWLLTYSLDSAGSAKPWLVHEDGILRFDKQSLLPVGRVLLPAGIGVSSILAEHQGQYIVLTSNSSDFSYSIRRSVQGGG